MCRNLFQLLFGKSIPLEPFPVLDTTNYLVEEGVDGQGLGIKLDNLGQATPNSRSSLASVLPIMFPQLLTITAPMAKTSSPTIPVKGMR